jgi:uncharacterized membrane protein
MTSEPKSSIFHIVMFAFDGQQTADGIMKDILASQKEGGYKVIARAVVEKDGKGKVHFHEPGRGGVGATLGIVAGGLLGLIGGPAGLLAWTVAGGVIGGTAGHYLGRAVSADDLQRIGNALDLNSSAILVLVEDKFTESAIDEMKGYNANVITITVGDEMSGEIATAIAADVTVPADALPAEAKATDAPAAEAPKADAPAAPAA